MVVRCPRGRFDPNQHPAERRSRTTRNAVRLGRHSRALKLRLLAGLAVLATTSSCSREVERKPPAGNAAPAVQPPVALLFPEGMAADDQVVRAFVAEAMRTCSAGNYEDFRLLWSAREEPLSREEFTRSFRAVKSIRVRALEKALLAGDDPQAEAAVVYAMYGEIDLDPSQPIGERQPTREIVLMLVREHDQWRFAQAPKAMREWVKSKVNLPGPPASADQTGEGP